MKFRNPLLILFLITACLQLAACTQNSAKVTKIEPSRLEDIEGSDFKRVVLTEKAAERIGVQTDIVREEQVTRTLRIGGKVMSSPDEAASAPGAGGAITNLEKVRVQVRLSESDLQRLDQGQPVFVMLLDEDENEDIDDDEEEAGFAAEPDEAQDFDDIEDDEEGGTKALYYVVNATDNRLAPGQRVLVSLSLAGNEKQRLVIPYAAVIYGVQGETWVYTLSEPLNYVRYPINIEYIEGGLAVLSEGPPPGTRVVTVGTAELLGAETGVSK